MTWRYYTIDTNGIYYSNAYSTNSTTANDYFSDYTRSFTTTNTGTTYGLYDQQTFTLPHTIIRRDYIDIYNQEHRHHPERYQEHRPQEHIQQQPQPQPFQKTPEQIKEETEATERAKNLLLEYLDDDNKQKLSDKKHLEIASKLFKDVKYHIPLSKMGRIKALKNNNIITELCLLVRETEKLPIEDVVLTKLLHVMNDEVNMLKTAHHHNVKENLLIGLNTGLN